MNSTPLATVANAIGAALNAMVALGTLNSNYSAAEIAFLPDHEREDLEDETKLIVVPKNFTVVRESRLQKRITYFVEVAMQRALTQTSFQSDCELLSADGEKFAMLLLDLKLTGNSGASIYCSESEFSALPEMEHLESLRVFTAVVKTQFIVLENN